MDILPAVTLSLIEYAVYTRTPTMYLHVTLQPQSQFVQKIPSEYRGDAVVHVELKRIHLRHFWRG